MDSKTKALLDLEKEEVRKIVLRENYGKLHVLLNKANLIAESDGMDPEVDKAIFKAFELVQRFL